MALELRQAPRVAVDLLRRRRRHALGLLLLSRGATVISERAYYKDEHEYAGLVTFGAVDALPSILEQRLIRGSTSDSTRPLQTNATVAALYARRFAPQRIFARARIYTDLLGTPDIVSAHSLHLWSLTADIPVISVHLTAKPDTDHHQIRADINR